jgi:hypothetical protein
MLGPTRVHPSSVSVRRRSTSDERRNRLSDDLEARPDTLRVADDGAEMALASLLPSKWRRPEASRWFGPLLSPRGLRPFANDRYTCYVPAAVVTAAAATTDASEQGG